jgi:radical SAM-linked protein
MNESIHFRYRIEYSKTSMMRFIGHLDMMRVWERTFRRAQLPMAYSQGFNPHPRINLGLALPLGYISHCELLDIWLTEDIQSEVFRQRVRNRLPPGIELQVISQISPSTPNLQKQIRAVIYDVHFAPDPMLDPLQGKIDTLLASQQLMRERRGKIYDLRPLIQSLECMRLDNAIVLNMCLSAEEGQTGRPDEVLLQLDLDPSSATIIRKQLILIEPTAEKNQTS